MELSFHSQEISENNFDIEKEINKCLQIAIINHTSIILEQTIKRNEIEIKTLNEELYTTYQNIWSAEDEFCQRIWNFSYEHDFSKIFFHYLDIINLSESKNENFYAIDKKDTNSNMENDTREDEEINNLLIEIDNLKKEICTLTSKEMKKKIQSSLIQLEKLKLFSQEVTEFLKSIIIFENIALCQNQNQKPKPDSIDNTIVSSLNINTIAKDFIRAKELIQTNHVDPRILPEQNNSILKVKDDKNNIKGDPLFHIQSAKSINNIKNEHSHTVTKRRFNNFSIKKQSNVSLKFEESRQSKKKRERI